MITVLLHFLFDGSVLGDFLKTLFLITGIHKIWVYYRLTQNRNHPTPQMYAAQSFFTMHNKRVDAVCEWLADAKSREVYKKIIKLRQFCDVKDIPQFSYFDQYFPKDIITLSNKEVFIDCGAFNGDTVKAFLKRVNSYTKIVAFEPDSKNAHRFEKNIKGKENITLIRSGVFDKNTQLFFNSGIGSGAAISNQQSAINNQQSTISNQQSMLLLLIAVLNVKMQLLLKWILRERNCRLCEAHSILSKEISQNWLFVFIIVMKIWYVLQNTYIQLYLNINYMSALIGAEQVKRCYMLYYKDE